MRRMTMALACAVLMLVGARTDSDAALSGVSVNYIGAGGQIGLVIPDGLYLHHYHGWNYYNYVVDVNVGFHVAAQVKVGFELGKYGTAYYYPSVGVWFGGDHHHYNHVDFFATELQMNLIDLAYSPPLHIPVKPYVGLGGPAILIDIVRSEDPDGYHEHETDVRAAFNLFAGCDFEVSPSLRPFVEMRGSVGDWNIFKLIGGLTFTIR